MKKQYKWDYSESDGLRTYNLKNGSTAKEKLDANGNKYLLIDNEEKFIQDIEEMP